MQESKNHDLQIIQRKEGIKVNISETARRLNVCWATAKKLLSGQKKNERPPKQSILDPYKVLIIEKIDKCGCTAKSVFRYLQTKGFTGSYSTVKIFVKKHIREMNHKAYLRVLNGPGIQAQVDWKESIKLVLKSGEIVVCNLFLYILSFSKLKFIKLTTDRTQPTVFKCLIDAFEYCDGIPQEIWFDNMKTVVDSHDVSNNEVHFNSKFSVFAKECGFTPIACRPYRPNTIMLRKILCYESA